MQYTVSSSVIVFWEVIRTFEKLAGSVLHEKLVSQVWVACHIHHSSPESRYVFDDWEQRRAGQQERQC